MPVRISHLVKDRRTLAIPIDGETLLVTYLPSKLTPTSEDRLSERLKDQRGGAALAGLLAEMLASWDLTDDDGKVLPTNEKTLATLPTTFLSTVATAITEDLRPNQARSGT